MCQTCKTRNCKAMDLNAFHSKLRQSPVFTALCTYTNCFSYTLRECVVDVLDGLVPFKLMTERSGKSSIKCFSSEFILARRNIRQLERLYGRKPAASDRLAYGETCGHTKAYHQEVLTEPLCAEAG